MVEKISVIIPAYQAEPYLPEAVSSVRGQNWPGGLEVIIVDDGSHDGTLALAQRLGDIALTKERGGAASARNAGLRAAAGDLIMLLDADDVLMPGTVARLYTTLTAKPELAAAFGLVRDFVSPELTVEQRQRLHVRPEPYGGFLTGCSLIRRWVFEKIGYFDETLKTGETVAWMLNLRDAGLLTVNLDDVVLKRRLHLTNTGRVNTKQEMLSYAAILRQRMRRK